MPITKTAKRALRSSKRKGLRNSRLIADLEAAIRIAKKDKKEASIKKAISFTDKAVKKGIIHKNKAARIKSRLSKKPSKKTKK